MMLIGASMKPKQRKQSGHLIGKWVQNLQLLDDHSKLGHTIVIVGLYNMKKKQMHNSCYKCEKDAMYVVLFLMATFSK